MRGSRKLVQACVRPLSGRQRSRLHAISFCQGGSRDRWPSVVMEKGALIPARMSHEAITVEMVGCVSRHYTELFGFYHCHHKRGKKEG